MTEYLCSSMRRWRVTARVANIIRIARITFKFIDREASKIIVENGGKHPLGSTALCYLAREHGGRGLRSVEKEYKAIKIKNAFKLYKNTDPTMNLVRRFEERFGCTGPQLTYKEGDAF